MRDLLRDPPPPPPPPPQSAGGIKVQIVKEVVGGQSSTAPPHSRGKPSPSGRGGGGEGGASPPSLPPRRLMAERRFPAGHAAMLESWRENEESAREQVSETVPKSPKNRLAGVRGGGNRRVSLTPPTPAPLDADLSPLPGLYPVSAPPPSPTSPT